MTTLLKLYKDLKTGNFTVMDTHDPILCPFQYIQSSPSTEWIISHKRNTFNLIVQVFVNNRMIKPHDVQFTDANTMKLVFTIPVSGVANIASYTSDVNCIPLVTPTVTPTNTMTPTVTSTVTPTNTPTHTPTSTRTPTTTVTPTLTPQRTVTPTISVTPSITPSSSG